MALPVIKSTTNWADESADLSPDWSPTAAPEIPGDDHFSLEESAAVSQQEREEEHLPTGMGAPQSFCVYVGGLPYSASEDELGFFFLDRNITPVGVRIIMDRETKKSKGFGYLDFATVEDYEAALQMSGANFGGRTIRVSAEEHRREPRRRSREPRGGPRRDDFEFRRDDRREFGRDDREFHRGGRDSHREHNREVFERTPEEAAEHHERKKLQLKPRTKPLEEMHEDAAGQQRSSIFGNAKPRDEAEYQRRKAEREERLGVSTTSKDGKDTAEAKHHSGGSTKAAPSEASSALPHMVVGKGNKGGKGRHISSDTKSANWRGKGKDVAPIKRSPEVAPKEPVVRTVDTGPTKVKGALVNAFAGLSDSESESDSE
ncbi:eukaryotic translation initiation factor 4B/4H, putative [Perkinsus marinus ATCC 50983]|uniref:Eukaryotic translation initiation factor 4B/4H, putative n=1 Tax=Perkinsus marinus (strain ATCC 50983 / TXsc) TaxID=423536 RepID=C5LUX9_PERM5|nr:eukaryotic translation initiation factor 4B/4H, putative [Perkinsus marinus ATCC 50983]EEQ99479.1 eukaryotic translation initiation factor 4B/4H, putative [Perkinsus marinus ATCC 50983]|eukprot:XP_002766762.1 eukaryotic translation initiation factor 4B/4H, putative [Perkinsus marinus ATCC 50983]